MSKLIELTGISALTQRQIEAVLKALIMTLDIDEMRRFEGSESDCRLTRKETVSVRQAYEKLEQAVRFQCQ